MYIICYHANGSTQMEGGAYGILPIGNEIADPFTIQEAVSGWKEDNPDCTVDYIFSTRNNIMDTPLYGSHSFREYAEKYGLDPELEGKPVSIFGAQNCIFAAIYPSKRKYPIVVYNTDNGEYIRITAEYARRMAQYSINGQA